MFEDKNKAYRSLWVHPHLNSRQSVYYLHSTPNRVLARFSWNRVRFCPDEFTRGWTKNVFFKHISGFLVTCIRCVQMIFINTLAYWKPNFNPLIETHHNLWRLWRSSNNRGFIPLISSINEHLCEQKLPSIHKVMWSASTECCLSNHWAMSAKDTPSNDPPAHKLWPLPNWWMLYSAVLGLINGVSQIWLILIKLQSTWVTSSVTDFHAFSHRRCDLGKDNSYPKVIPNTNQLIYAKYQEGSQPPSVIA